jgi:hypothetical protein
VKRQRNILGAPRDGLGIALSQLAHQYPTRAEYRENRRLVRYAKAWTGPVPAHPKVTAWEPVPGAGIFQPVDTPERKAWAAKANRRDQVACFVMDSLDSTLRPAPEPVHLAAPRARAPHRTGRAHASRASATGPPDAEAVPVPEAVSPDVPRRVACAAWTALPCPFPGVPCQRRHSHSLKRRTPCQGWNPGHGVSHNEVLPKGATNLPGSAGSECNLARAARKGMHHAGHTRTAAA